MKSILALVFLALSLSVYSQEELKTFRGHAWGTSFQEMSSQLQPADTRTTMGMKAYSKNGEELVFEGLSADNILYLFKRNELVAGTIAMDNGNLDKLIEILTGKYGEPKKTDAVVLTNYEWKLSAAMLVVTHIPSASNNIGVSVQIKGK